MSNRFCGTYAALPVPIFHETYAGARFDAAQALAANLSAIRGDSPVGYSLEAVRIAERALALSHAVEAQRQRTNR